LLVCHCEQLTVELTRPPVSLYIFRAFHAKSLSQHLRQTPHLSCRRSAPSKISRISKRLCSRPTPSPQQQLPGYSTRLLPSCLEVNLLPTGPKDNHKSHFRLAKPISHYQMPRLLTRIYHKPMQHYLRRKIAATQWQRTQEASYSKDSIARAPFSSSKVLGNRRYVRSVLIDHIVRREFYLVSFQAPEQTGPLYHITQVIQSALHPN